jgi:hypothetical protein
VRTGANIYLLDIAACFFKTVIHRVNPVKGFDEDT